MSSFRWKEGRSIFPIQHSGRWRAYQFFVPIKFDG